jgi:hypothetical protein
MTSGGMMLIPHLMKVSQLTKNTDVKEKKCRLKVLIFSLYFIATVGSVY